MSENYHLPRTVSEAERYSQRRLAGLLAMTPAQFDMNIMKRRRLAATQPGWAGCPPRLAEQGRDCAQDLKQKFAGVLSLSETEYHVFTAMATGRKQVEIAETKGHARSVSSVNTHVTRIKAKLLVGTLAALYALAGEYSASALRREPAEPGQYPKWRFA